MPFIRAFLQDLFWNGTILFFEISYLSYLIDVRKFLAKMSEGSEEASFWVVVQISVLILFPIVITVVLSRKDNKILITM